MKMPELETKRTLLRPLTIEDAAALNVVNRNPQVMRYIGPVEDSVEKTRQYLRQGPLADYQKFGFGRHACIDKHSGQLIGFSGLKYLPELDDVDIGYRFLPEYWGKGLATETSQACMDYARKQLQLKRIIGLALPDNNASIHVLKKLDLTYETTLDFRGELCVLYASHAKSAEG